MSVENNSDSDECLFVFLTFRKFYGLLIQLIFKCVINNRDEVVEIKLSSEQH